MRAADAQEVVDLVEEILEKAAADPTVESDAVVCDGSMYSPSSRAIPWMSGVWEADDPEAWEYVDGKVDDKITELGFYWDDGMLRKGGA